MSTLTIVLLVLGGVSLLGAGSCVVCGGLAIIGASADSDPASGASGTSTAASASDASAAAASTTSPPATAATTTPTAMATGNDDTSPTSPTAAATTTATATATTTPTAGGTTTWWCTASGSVTVCGFAGVCSPQMVFGNGGGTDRFLASQQAKMACEGMARAKGGTTVCVVSCQPRQAR